MLQAALVGSDNANHPQHSGRTFHHPQNSNPPAPGQQPISQKSGNALRDKTGLAVAWGSRVPIPNRDAVFGALAEHVFFVQASNVLINHANRVPSIQWSQYQDASSGMAARQNSSWVASPYCADRARSPALPKTVWRRSMTLSLPTSFGCLLERF
jgi:hypothetical protein